MNLKLAIVWWWGNRYFSLWIALVFCLAGVGPDRAAGQTTRPNIVHIFADDLGKGSVGIYGQLAREQAGLQHIKTPNLDALARSGLSFDRAYSATLCSPSRGMLHMGFNQAHNANDRNTVSPRAQDVSVAQVLKQADYRTGIFGKWGFGGGGGTQTSSNKTDDLRINPSVTNTSALPNSHGYDEFTGYLNHGRAHRYYTSSLWTTDVTGNPVTSGLSEQMLNNVGPNNTNLHEDYTHDVIVARSEQFIATHHQDVDPFYLQVNYTIPHNDLEAIQHQPGWFDAYDGVNTSSWTNKERYYAAMITRMDQSVGQLIDRLEDPNGDGDASDSVLQDTMVIFTSDNGATQEDLTTAGLDAFGINDLYRGGKRDLWEGGINMPMFVRWDGMIQPDTISDLPTDLTDFMATAAAVAGVQAPVGIDGVSLLPELTGIGTQRHRDYLVFEHHEGDGPDPNSLDPRWAIIRGDQKLIKFSNGERRLYDLALDPDENNQLNQTLPENAALVTELTSLAIAEGVEQPASYQHDYGRWLGSDGGDLGDASQWNLGSVPQPTWSTVVGNASGADSVVHVTAGLDALGLEVQGDTGSQTVRVGQRLDVIGRNEVRIDTGGRIHLDDAQLVSWRWTDVLAGGALTGHGSVEGDLYNAGTVAPGLPSDLPAPPPVPVNVDTGIVSAVVFDFSGVQDSAPLTRTTTLSPFARVIQGFNFGPGVYARDAANDGNEFNVTGFSGGGTSLADAIVAEDYLSFGLAPVHGVEMLVDEVAFELRRNGVNAAREFAILTSLDGFDANGALASLSLGSGDVVSHTLSGSYTGGQWTNETVDVRIYGWDQAGNAGNTHFYAVSMSASFRSIPGDYLDVDATGNLALNGDFYHVADSKLVLDLGGTDNSDALDLEHDSVTVLGRAELEGDLVILLEDGFSPGHGDEFSILTAEQMDGEFVHASVPDLGSTMQWSLAYSPSQVMLRIIAAGDYNRNGIVDAADFTVWRDSLGTRVAALTGADANGDGMVTELDYVVWMENFGYHIDSVMQVPEPATGPWLLVACAALFPAIRYQRRKAHAANCQQVARR